MSGTEQKGSSRTLGGYWKCEGRFMVTHPYGEVPQECNLPSKWIVRVHVQDDSEAWWLCDGCAVMAVGDNLRELNEEYRNG